MAHIRKQIRDKIKDLVSGLTLTQNKVFYDIVYNLDSSKLPAIVVQTKDERIEKTTFGRPSIQNRVLNVSLFCVVQTNENYQDVLDSILLEIEHKIYNNLTLDNLVTRIEIDQIETDTTDTLQKTTAIMEINLVVEYRAKENNLEISI